MLSADLRLDPAARERLEREARAVSALNHPHICTLYDVGKQDDVAYLVMEYVEGESLASRLAKGRCRSPRRWLSARIWRPPSTPRIAAASRIAT